MLEGKTEKAFIELLIEKNLFSINVDDMLDLRPHAKRKLDSYLISQIRQLPPNKKVIIVRIGDKMKDKLKKPKDIKGKIKKELKYCTKPEFEMLVIINENFYDEYQKVKSITMPKEFIKTKKINYNVKSNNIEKDVRLYFNKIDLKYILLEYKRKAKHEKDELFLVDLLK